eukprot:CAMPEP_0181215092 /NCGR_PEP_ID=MMETSP1096-20121128/25824_1 /TAXON_ID=156174 ORGANISM="Chrysochromulina ericina, Strain CCMP281" /NCGR_SAMPLE_ID=MMETSP1096 /ASSEMBLY_ACC=CAM_ASM_000453 /LENGTH=246 /DNA_ID=CAMNT_0023306915 /DNA_START=212 /DNA_END=955 /DNA_ORIENTATION=+
MHVCQAGGRVSSLEDGGSLETPKTDHVPGPVCTPLVSLLTPPLLSRDLLIRNAQSDSRSAHTAPDGDASPSSASPLGLDAYAAPPTPPQTLPTTTLPAQRTPLTSLLPTHRGGAHVRIRSIGVHARRAKVAEAAAEAAVTLPQSREWPWACLPNPSEADSAAGRKLGSPLRGDENEPADGSIEEEEGVDGEALRLGGTSSPMKPSEAPVDQKKHTATTRVRHMMSTLPLGGKTRQMTLAIFSGNMQ